MSTSFGQRHCSTQTLCFDAPCRLYRLMYMVSSIWRRTRMLLEMGTTSISVTSIVADRLPADLLRCFLCCGWWNSYKYILWVVFASWKWPRVLNMIIQFGSRRTPFAKIHTFLLGLIVGGIVMFNGILQERLGASQRSMIDSRGLNITHSVNYFYCELPYNDCLCTVLWNTSNTSETCITYAQLAASRRKRSWPPIR